METQNALVVLNVPPVVEEPVVDWLLARENGGGFASSPVAGHSSANVGLSAAEQVSGRQRRYQFQVQIELTELDAFIAGFREEFGAADVRYWVLPVLTAGP